MLRHLRQSSAGARRREAPPTAAARGLVGADCWTWARPSAGPDFVRVEIVINARLASGVGDLRPQMTRECARGAEDHVGLSWAKKKYKSIGAAQQKAVQGPPPSRVISVTADAPDVCAICIEALSPRLPPGPAARPQLRCSHRFHRECLAKWLKLNPTCPVCRAPAADERAETPWEAIRAERVGWPFRSSSAHVVGRAFCPRGALGRAHGALARQRAALAHLDMANFLCRVLSRQRAALAHQSSAGFLHRVLDAVARQDVQ